MNGVDLALMCVPLILTLLGVWWANRAEARHLRARREAEKIKREASTEIERLRETKNVMVGVYNALSKLEDRLKAQEGAVVKVCLEAGVRPDPVWGRMGLSDN